MPRELVALAPETLDYREFPLEPLTAREVRISAQFGAVKHGTEFLGFSGKSPFVDFVFDGEQRMFVKTEKKERPFHYRAGNTIVGTITEAGNEVDRFKPGDRVYCYSPFREIVTTDESRVKPLLPPMTETDAVCADPALFGFGAVRDGKVSAGDTAVVMGLGAIGLFAVQFLRMSGCAEIIAFDPIEKRRLLAKQFGATLVGDPLTEEPGALVHRHLKRGADVAFEISGTYQGLQSSLRCVAMCGRIVTVGFYKGNNAPLQLSMEWHHNRLELISSMPDWGNPLRDHPLWDRIRLQETIVRFFREGRLTSAGVVDPIVGFAQARDAYLGIYRNPSASVKLGVRFS